MIQLFLAFGSANAQDPSFSQFFSNQLYLNPAYVGNPNYHQIQAVYRNQWLTRKSPFQSYGISYDRMFIEQNSGFGVNIINDNQGNGAINRVSADLLYSYNFQVSYNFQIRGGIQAGTIVKSQNTKDLVFSDMIDPSGEITGTPGFSGQNQTSADFGVGVLAQWDFIYAGIAVHHLNQPIDHEDRERKIIIHRKYTVNLGADINLNQRYIYKKKISLSPNIIYQQQQNYKQINFGLYLSQQNLLVGLWLRENIDFTNHTFIFLAGYYNESYTFAYSYDFSIMQNGFRGLNTSSHEVTFGMNFQYKSTSRKKINTIKSPKF